jgi:hypothetical protein
MEKAELEIMVAATLAAGAFERCSTDPSAEGAIDLFMLTLDQMRTREIISRALSGKPLTRS